MGLLKGENGESEPLLRRTVMHITDVVSSGHVEKTKNESTKIFPS